MITISLYVLDFYSGFKSQSIHFFYRFMGESKCSVKNKAKVERSICAAYLHRETTYFYSHYFKNFIFSPSNVRNETHWKNETCDSTLLVFRQVGHHASKELTYWLTDVKFIYAHVHVLINCVEVKSYLEYVLISIFVP